MQSVFFERPGAEMLRRATAGWRQMWVWLPVISMVLVICVESTGTFSSENTSGWIRPVVERFFGHINDRLWMTIHFTIRKSGHMTGYGLLCLTFIRAWLLTLGRRVDLTVAMWRARSCAMALASTFVVASCDEWHQTFLPSRTGLFTDVLVDSTGASVMCGLVWVICWSGLGRKRRTYAEFAK